MEGGADAADAVVLLSVEIVEEPLGQVERLGVVGTVKARD